MITSSATITEVTAKGRFLQNSYFICYTDFPDQFSHPEYHVLNHYGSPALRDPDKMQFDIVLVMGRGSIKSLVANYNEVIA